MARYLVLVAIFLALSGCGPSRYQTQMQQFEQQKNSCISSQPPAVDKFESGASVRMEQRIGCVPVERGMHRGMEYFIDHSTGRAEFSSSPADLAWVVICEKDAVTDRVSAKIIKGNLMVFRMGGFDSVSVVGQAYPGSDQTVRVDQNHALIVQGGDRPDLHNGGVIIEQLKAGQSFLTRYVDWPYGINQDREFSAAGFDVAHEYSRRCVP